MSSCDNSNIKKNYIVTGIEQDILSACTAIYTNSIENCSGNTLDINSSILSTNDINATNITLSGVLSACTGIYTSNLYGCSPITIQDELILSAVTNNNTATQILTRNTTTGLVEYRDVSSITPDTNTFVTGTTFNSNQAVLTRNDGFDVLKLSGGSNVTLSNPSTNQIKIDVSIPPDTNTFVTGGTYNPSTDTITLTRNDSVQIDITGVTDTFTTGGTYNGGTKEINFVGNSVDTTFDVDLTSLVSSVSANTFVISGTYVDSTDTLSLLRNDGNFVNVTGITDTFTTGSTYDNSTATATFTRNDGNTYTLDLSTIDVNDTFSTGFTYDNVNTFTISRNDGVDLLTNITTLSGVTYYGSGIGLTNIPLSAVTNLQTELDSKLNISDFNTYSGNVQTQLDSKVENGVNSGGASEVFSGKSGTDLYFRTISGGTNTTVTTIGDIIKIDSADDNFYVTGFTYNDANTLTISQNGGLGDLTSTINTMTGLTIYGDLYVTGDTTLGPLTATSVTSNSEINVFNGHVNLRDNSYFLQGRTGADVNVSLIGVDNQDRVFVGNAGYDTYIDSNTIVNGVLSAQTTFLTTTPTLNNSATDILVRNNSTGEVEYRPVSGITPDTNTFVISGTYVDSTDTLSLLRNDGNFVNVTGITDTFTTGSTYDNGTATATFTRNNGTSYTLDLSTIDVNDTFSTGGTVTQSSSNNENNQTIQIVGNDGFTPFNITGVTDTFVTGGTYNNGTLTLNRQDGYFTVSGFYVNTGTTNVMSTSGITASTVNLDININYYGINHTSNVDITLPNPTGYDGYNINIKDESGNASIYRIRLIPLFGLIDNIHSYVDMNIDSMSLHIVARNNKWWII